MYDPLPSSGKDCQRNYAWCLNRNRHTFTLSFYAKIAVLDIWLIMMVISDDTFAIPLRTRLVSIAALLRRYSPSPHPLLRLLSHVPALPPSNSSLLFSYMRKLVSFTRLYSGGPSRLLGNLNRSPPKNASFNLKADSSIIWRRPGSFWESAFMHSPKIFTLLSLLPPDPTCTL
jgi:hypothetical protein